LETAASGRTADAFLKVEPLGIEAVPDAERHGRPRELAFLWAGAFVNYASVLTASLLTTYYGLGVWDGFAAVLLGTICGAVLLGLLSNTGPATGLPQVIFTRRVYGLRGAYAGAFLTLFLAVGWFAVDCVIAAQAGVQLLQLLGVDHAVAGKLLFPCVLVVATISVAVAVYGHATIKVLETAGAVTFALLSAVLFALLAPHLHWTATASAPSGSYAGAFALGFMSCFALVASWYPFASDYSRYLPRGSSRAAVTGWAAAGIAVPMALLGLLGLLLPTIDPRLAASDGVLAVITRHAPIAVALPFFAFVVAGEVWANYLDVYTAGLVTLTLGIRLRRWQSALLCGGLGTALAAVAVVVWDFHAYYVDFLVLTYLWAPAWAAVVLMAFFLLGHGRPLPALVAWAFGTAISLLFVNYPNVFSNVSNLHAFNQPLVDLLRGADISGVVSAAVAAASYWVLRRALA
jgi:NCS1 family nucleobase:cation symporter-1